MTTLESFIAEVKSTEAQATSGPWHLEVEPLGDWTPIHICAENMNVLLSSSHRGRNPDFEHQMSDCRFVNRSRTYVPKLVRLVEVLMEHMGIVHAHNCEGRDPLIMKCNCHAPEQFSAAIAAALAGSKGCAK